MANGFHDFEKKNRFQKLKKNLTSQFCSFYLSFCYLISLVNNRSNMTLWVSREGVKRDCCPKIFF